METDKIFVLIDNFIQQGELIAKLAAKEAKLALLSIKAMALMIVLSFIIVASAWLIFLIFVGYEFYLYTSSYALALLGSFLVNLLCYFIIKIFIKILRSSITFKATRQQLLITGANKDVN